MIKTNNYKERYQSLAKDISVITKDKEWLEISLTEKEKELADRSGKKEVLVLQLLELEDDKNIILNNKNKIITILINLSRIIALIGTTMLVASIYNNISTLGIFGKILILSGVTYGGVVLLALELAVLKKIENSFKRKRTNKTKTKKEYLQVMEQINNKRQELDYEKTVQDQIAEEMNNLTNNINEQKRLLSLKKEDLTDLFQEILSETLQEPLHSETMPSFQEIPTTSRPKRKIKLPRA